MRPLTWLIERAMPWNAALALHALGAVLLACGTYLVSIDTPHGVVVTIARATAEPVDGEHDGPTHEREDPPELRDGAASRRPAPHECEYGTPETDWCGTCQQWLFRSATCVVVDCGRGKLWLHGYISVPIRAADRCAECDLGLRAPYRGYNSPKPPPPAEATPRATVTSAR